MTEIPITRVFSSFVRSHLPSSRSYHRTGKRRWSTAVSTDPSRVLAVQSFLHAIEDAGEGSNKRMISRQSTIHLSLKTLSSYPLIIVLIV